MEARQAIVKKAQITYFIFIALIILIFYILLTVPSIKETNPEMGIEESAVASVRDYVDKCTNEAAEGAVTYTALQGGLYNKTEHTVSYPFFIIPLYSEGKVKTVPTIAEIEEQLSFSIQDGVERCVNNFTIFADKGQSLDFSRPIAKSSILDGQVLFEVNFSIRLLKEDSIISVPHKYKAAIPSDYKKMYEFADYIATINSQDPDNLCISCISSYGTQHNLDVIVSNFDIDTVAFVINSQENRRNETFRFAHGKNAQT